MKPKINLVKTVLFLFLIFFIGLLSACSKKPEQVPQPPKGNKAENMAKPPKELNEMQSALEKMMAELWKKEKEKTEPVSSMQSQGEEKSEQQEQEKSQQKSGTEQGETQQNKGQGMQKGQIDWAKQMEVVKNLHMQWNLLEVELVKAGAKEELINRFEEQLDNLTMEVEGKNLKGALYSANELYGYFPEFSGLYKTQNPPDIERFRYYTTKIILDAQNNDWIQAQKDIQDLKLVWKPLKARLEGEATVDINRMDYALTDAEKALMAQKQQIAIIKGEILLKNLEEVKKKIKEQEKKQQSS